MERDHDDDWRTGDDLAARPRRAAPPGVETDRTGIPVIAGTGIEAHRIAALLDGGMAVGEVLGDYISLTRDQVLAAKAYADVHPWTGAPFPRITVKKAMRDSDLSDLEPFLPTRQ